MQKLLSIFFLITGLFVGSALLAQVKGDSVKTVVKKDSTKTKSELTDSTGKKIKKFDPRIATRRSAMIPGWGQIYNRKYWKLPLVYGGLGISAGVFFYNLKTYKILRKAYIYKVDTDSTNDVLIDPRFQRFSAEAIRQNRNLFRQNIDYSALFFILFWGLNIVDATVDGHLKQFDVNDNLSLELKQGYSQLANTTGLTLLMDIHSKRSKAAKLPTFAVK